jgi:hypothetical protein
MCTFPDVAMLGYILHQSWYALRWNMFEHMIWRLH